MKELMAMEQSTLFWKEPGGTYLQIRGPPQPLSPVLCSATDDRSGVGMAVCLEDAPYGNRWGLAGPSDVQSPAGRGASCGLSSLPARLQPL